MKYFPEIFSPDFGTKQKLHLFVFFCWVLSVNLFPRKRFSFPEEEFSGKKQEVARFKNNQTFSPTIQIIFMMAFERSAMSSGFNWRR